MNYLEDIKTRNKKYLTDAEKEEVNKQVNRIITSTNKQNNALFWNFYEGELLEACFYYCAEVPPKTSQHIFNVRFLLEHINTEKCASEKDIFDLMFEALEIHLPDSIAVKKYHVYNAMPHHCRRAVVEACKSRLENYVRFNNI